MNRKLATMICCFAMGVFGVVLAIISPLISEISNDFGLTTTQAGTIFTVNFIGFITFILLSGAMSRIIQKRILVTVAMLGLSISLLAFSMSKSTVLLLIAVFFIGGFGSILESMLSAMVADLNPDNTTYYINLTQIYLCIGAVLGPLFASFMANYNLSWRAGYQSLSVLAIIFFVIFLFIYFIRNNPQENIIREKLSSNTDLQYLTKNSQVIGAKPGIYFWILALCMILYTGSEVGLWGWMATYYKGTLHLSQSSSAQMVSVFWIAMTVGRIICGKLVERINEKNLILILSSITIVVCLLMGTVNTEFTAYLLSAALGLSLSSLYPFILSCGSKLWNSSIAFSVLVGCGGLGTIVIPFAMGYLSDKIGPRAAIMTPAIAYGVIVVTFVIWNWKESQKSNIAA